MIDKRIPALLFTVFKDLVSKMLNPSRQLRIKIPQIQKHFWITGAFGEEFAPIGEKWKSETYQKYAKSSNLTIDEISDEISNRPYGQLGGIFNIEKHFHQVNKIALKRAPSCATIIKVINHIDSIFPSQISTLLTENDIKQLIR